MNWRGTWGISINLKEGRKEGMKEGSAFPNPADRAKRRTQGDRDDDDDGSSRAIQPIGSSAPVRSLHKHLTIPHHPDIIMAFNRQGLSNRWPASNDQLQVRVDVLQGDVDEEIEGLQSKVRKLKGVALAIETEGKFQNELLSQLESTVMRAQAELKNTMKRLNKSVIQRGSNHVVHVILFALLCFFLVYLWSKVSK